MDKLTPVRKKKLISKVNIMENSEINDSQSTSKVEVNDNSIDSLTGLAGLIFSGTVVQHNATTISIIPASQNLVVIRVDDGLHVDPVLGDIKGKMITMAARDVKTLPLKERAVFFTNSWIHGGGIAVRELGHISIGEEQKVVAAISQLPTIHLQDRLRGSSLVVLGEITDIQEVPDQNKERSAPKWARAVIRAELTLKGDAKTASLFFPTSIARPWYKAPRFQLKQEGIFILSQNKDDKLFESFKNQDNRSEIFTALDPADFQPKSQLELIKKLLTTLNSKEVPNDHN